MSVAVCPHPPAIVPAVSRGAAGAFDEMRAASVDAVRRLAAGRPDVVVCVGVGPQTRAWGADSGGTLRGFGVDATFGGSDRRLPLSLTIAAYLLQESGTDLPALYQAVSDGESPSACSRLGAEVARSCPRVALLVMGDGSARRSTSAPGYLDPRAAGFDAAATAALAEADSVALLGIEPDLARELWVGGRVAWQVLAGALATSPYRLQSRVLYDDAPLGVGSFVVHMREA